jgi:hypothetical protein
VGARKCKEKILKKLGKEERPPSKPRTPSQATRESMGHPHPGEEIL